MERERILELFLELLARAKKSVPLYPPESPAVREWVRRLAQGIPQFIADGLRFPLRFEAHHVRSGETALLTIDPILDRLRFDVLTRGIEEVTIEEAVEEHEVMTFLNLLIMDPFAIREEGGPQAVLRNHKVTRIGVRQIALAAGADRGKEQEWRTLTIEEWVQLLVDQALRAVATHLRALALNRTELSLWLQVVGRGDRVDLLYIGVRTVCGLAASEQEPSLFLRTIAEAVYDLPEPLLVPLARDWLFPRAMEDVEALNLINNFSEDELQRLAQRLPEEALLALAAALAELPLENARNQRLSESLAGMIENRTAEFLPRLPTVVDEGTVERVRETVTASSQPDGLLEIGVRVLLAVLFHGENQEYPSSAMDALEESVGLALSRGRLDLALEILNGVRSGALRGEWLREHARRSAALLKRAADQTHVALLAGLLRENRTAEDAERITHYLRMVGEEGIRQFAGLLAEERNRPVRAFMCRVLVRVGRAAVPSLQILMEDRRWYVARNAVALLGRIGDASALPSISGAARHPDPRVRREAARALGAWAEGVAVTPLIKLLEDSDPTVQMAVVKVLGEHAIEEAVRPLQDLALSQNGKAAEFSVRKEALRALATMGTRAGRAAIREIAHRRLWIWKRQERQLRALAARAARGEGLP